MQGTPDGVFESEMKSVLAALGCLATRLPPAFALFRESRVFQYELILNTDHHDATTVDAAALHHGVHAVEGVQNLKSSPGAYVPTHAIIHF